MMLRRNLSAIPALLLSFPWCSHSLISLIDGGKTIPKLYNCYFDSQLAKQASTAVARAIAAGKTKLEVNFSPVYVLQFFRIWDLGYTLFWFGLPMLSNDCLRGLIPLVKITILLL
jgi:hypothetical protein